VGDGEAARHAGGGVVTVQIAFDDFYAHSKARRDRFDGFTRTIDAAVQQQHNAVGRRILLAGQGAQAAGYARHFVAHGNGDDHARRAGTAFVRLHQAQAGPAIRLAGLVRRF
jgi:hypothetical protein